MHNLCPLWHLKLRALMKTAGKTTHRRNNHPAQLLYFTKQNIPAQTQIFAAGVVLK